MNKLNPILISALALPALLVLNGCNPAGDTSAATVGKGASAATAPVNNIHEVAMRGDASGFYFEPKELTIAHGDLVRWTMVDGAPHNVNFKGQQFPQAARVLLESQRKLLGVMLAAPGQVHEIHFTDDFPPGEYNYVCDPHAMLNMVGKIIITE
jgi:plastocyanin